MGLLGRLKNSWTDPWKERRLSISEGSSQWVFGGETVAGVTVTAPGAMQLATAYACVKLTAAAVSVLPLKLYRKGADGGRSVVTDHNLATILDTEPNADQTALEFWETMVGRVALNGNALAHKVKQGRHLISLEPVHGGAFRTTSGELRYRVYDRGQAEEIAADDIFHLRGFSSAGDMSPSPVAVGAQSLGLAMAAEEAAAKLFANGLQASGLLTTDSSLKSEQRTQLQTIMEKYAGSKNAGKLMILEAGLTYQALTLNPEDSQMLESRRFHIEEICRWFGVPPIVIGHAAEGVTAWGTGVESILLHWYVTGINPLCTRIEQRIRKSLLNPAERATLYPEFTREGLLQMDSKAKSEFLSSMTQNGLMTRNEGRAKLNLTRSVEAGADKLTAQVNLAPLDMLGQTKPAAPPPA